MSGKDTGDKKGPKVCFQVTGVKSFQILFREVKKREDIALLTLIEGTKFIWELNNYQTIDVS